MEQEEIAIRVRHEHQDTEIIEHLTTDTPDHATTSDIQEEHQREEEPRVFTAEDYKKRSAQNFKPSATVS